MLKLVLIATTVLGHAQLRHTNSHAVVSLASVYQREEPAVPEGELDSHKGMQGKMSYHGYDEDWHTEYKGDIHHGSEKAQKEAFKPGYLHEEYTQNGPSNFGSVTTTVALAAVALIVG